MMINLDYLKEEILATLASYVIFNYDRNKFELTIPYIDLDNKICNIINKYKEENK